MVLSVERKWHWLSECLKKTLTATLMKISQSARRWNGGFCNGLYRLAHRTFMSETLTNLRSLPSNESCGLHCTPEHKIEERRLAVLAASLACLSHSISLELLLTPKTLYLTTSIFAKWSVHTQTPPPNQIRQSHPPCHPPKPAHNSPAEP
jgi:hypothetical protein